MILTRPVDAEFWEALGVAAHPVYPLPDEAWLRAATDQELINYLLERQEDINRMVEDPLHHGYEPPIWKILDALCGFPWIEDTAENRAWSLRVRRALLKQDVPVKVILLNGGNRGSKSEWAASRTIRILLNKTSAKAWCFHQDGDMSRQYQQPLLYKYMPTHLRTERGIKRNPTYVAFKPQTGFSEDHFVLPNFSDCDFRNYQQAFEKIQGGELDVVWCDELVPATWIKELKARIATRSGWLIITFTPIKGYTAAVKMFLDVGKTTVQSTAFMLPEDGLDARVDLAIAGEDPLQWLQAETQSNAIIMAGQPPVPEGRRFTKVPRVMRIPPERGYTVSRQAVFFFHSFDNPFGNAPELVHLYASETAAGKKMRFYGMASKMVAGKFPKFDQAVHVVEPAQVPKHGTRYHVADPCSGRNWFMIWALVDYSPAGKRVWIYREWPCPGQYVPGEGDMGQWAEPGDKHDGDKGPAQNSRGFGLLRYREEIDRLEGRPKFEGMPKASGQAGNKEDPDLREDPTPNLYRRGKLKPGHGEDIYERIMDSRFGAAPTPTLTGQTTLIESCAEEVDLHFIPASGRDISEGIDLINNLLDYKEDQKIGPMNAPRFYISSECLNTIFALQNWTGEDGLHGACKDPVDVLRYLLLHNPEDWSQGKPANAA